jgi:hypothetical protein
MTDSPPLTLSTCYAKNRRARAAVHYALDGQDRALCGVWRGTAAPDVAVTCLRCRETAEDATPAVVSPEAAVLAAAEAAMTGPPLVYVVTRETGLSLVYVPWNPLLGSVMRQIPGARWHREEKAWAVPALLTADTISRLSAAGAEVRAEPD